MLKVHEMVAGGLLFRGGQQMKKTKQHKNSLPNKISQPDLYDMLIKQSGYFLICASTTKKKQKKIFPLHASWKAKALKRFAISRLLVGLGKMARQSISLSALLCLRGIILW